MKKSRMLVLFVLLAFVTGLVGAKGPLLAKDTVLVIDLGGDVPETVPWNPVMSLFTRPKPVVLDKLVVLERAAHDKRIKGVVARITTAKYSFGKAQEFRQAIERFRRDSGKPIYAYLELEGGGNLEYYVATACERVYVSPASSLGLTGLATFRFYLGGLWDKIYVDMQVDQIAQYKSAADMLWRKDMSAAEREVANSILDSLYGQFVGAIAKSRKVSRQTVSAWVDAAWLVPEKYQQAGAIDGIKYLGQIVDEIGGKPETPGIGEREYLEFSARSRYRSSKAPKVKVIYGVGSIVSGDQPAGPFLPGNVIASKPMVEQLKKAMNDKSIAAVIFRVDSGGGSALASDLIWRATQQLKAKKPIVVSMSDVAGSGGYYISCGASSVVAQPGTITGSIGILTAHLSLGRLLRKIEVGSAFVGRGKFAGMGRIDKKMDAAALARVHDSIASLYGLFINRVGSGRGMSAQAVDKIGKGRIWTGEQAEKNGLVDKLGGFQAARDEVKRLLGLPPKKEIKLVYGHERVTLWKLITGRIEQGAAASLLAPEELELARSLRINGRWQPDQPLAIMPGPMRVQ